MYTLQYSHLKVFHLFLKSQISTNRIVCYSRPSTHPPPSLSVIPVCVCIYITTLPSTLSPPPSPPPSLPPFTNTAYTLRACGGVGGAGGGGGEEGGGGSQLDLTNEGERERERENFSLKETSNQERRDITVSALLFIYGWFPTAPS